MVIAHVLRSAHEVTVAPIRTISDEQEDKKKDHRDKADTAK